MMYDRILSIYLTPKAVDDIRVKATDFAKIVKETSKKPKRKDPINNSVEYQSNHHLPEVAPSRNI
jgi:hypothetical protein